MSMQEAREAAKENVPRDFSQVRRAKQFEKASTTAQSTFANLEGVLGTERAQAASETVMAHQLRRMGFDTEASAMSMQAADRLKAEDLREINLRKVKAEASGAELDLQNTRDIMANRGKSELQQLVDEREILLTSIDTATDIDEITSAERELGAVEARIDKLNFISLSDADERKLSKAGLNKQLENLADLEQQDADLALLEGILNDQKGSLASTSFGRFGARTAGFMELHFGLDPASISADTLISDVTSIDGSAAWVSAAIRHALTGAAMSPAEAVFLQPFLATPGEPLSKMLGKVQVIRRFIALGIEGRRALIQANSDNPATGDQWVERELRRADNYTPPYKKSKADPNDATSATEAGIAIIDAILKEQGGGELVTGE